MPPQFVTPIYGWKLLLIGGGWLLLGGLMLWLSRSEGAWQALHREQEKVPPRGGFRGFGWGFSVLGIVILLGGLTGSDNAADLGGCTWAILAGGVSAAILGLLARAFR